MQTLCLYHDDPDGRASAAIVRRVYGEEAVLHAIDYGDPVPWGAIRQAGRVIVVDFSLPAEDMLRIAENAKLVWIDHHVSAIEALTPYAGDWEGLRDTRQAACVLTWRYYFPDQPVPRAILLIGDWDTWAWEEPETGAFGAGLRQQDTDPENDVLWGRLLSGEAGFLADLVAQGEILRAARLRDIRRDVDRYAFEVSFDGHRTLAINQRGSGDIGEYIRELGYSLAYCYLDEMQDGVLMTGVSLYSAEVDVSEIAARYGGGGHRGAAGFAFPRQSVPFPPESKVRLNSPQRA